MSVEKLGSLGLALGSVLLTWQKARALAEQSAPGEVVVERPRSVPSNFSLPSPSPPQPKKSLLRSFKKLVTPSQAAVLTPLDYPQNTIPTPSEASEYSFCSGEHNVQTVENNQDNLDSSVELSVLNSEGIYDNVVSESCPVLDALNSDSSDHFPSDVFEQMDEQVAQLAEVSDRALNMQRGSSPSKLIVSFPVFRGDESEDVHEFVSNVSV